MRDEYDFSNAKPNPYAERVRGQPLSTPTTRAGFVIQLDADVAKDFPTSEAVNEALRKYRDLINARRTG